MSVKEQLESVLWYHQQERAKDVQIERLENLKRSLDGVSLVPVVPGKTPEDQREEVTFCIDEMIHMLSRERYDLFSRRLNAIEMIRKLEDTKELIIMAHRYFVCSDWEKIAEFMKCSVDEVKQCHDKAVRHLEKIQKQAKKKTK